MIYLICLIGFIYVTAMLLLSFGFTKLPKFSSEKLIPKTQFSIIIPFRNEAEHLPKLLESLVHLEYPSNLFEILFVDDASNDNSAAIIETAFKDVQNDRSIPFTILLNERHSASPKKDAITTAIKIAEHDWILTTDADCELPRKWLSTFDAYIQKKLPLMVAGPVRYKADKSIVEQFQYLDGLSLQAVTIGSFGLNEPLLCNGANLAYKKEAFISVDGFNKNDHIASGDDIFMLEKMSNWKPDKVQFLKSEDAIVTTYPQKNWPGVLNQRIRWSSKTSKQKNWYLKGLGMLVFLMNLLILAGAVYCIFQPFLVPYYISFLLLKVLSDFLVIRVSSNFFNSKINGLNFLVCNLWYPVLITMVVLSSLRGTYQWKGRIFEKHP